MGNKTFKCDLCSKSFNESKGDHFWYSLDFPTGKLGGNVALCEDCADEMHEKRKHIVTDRNEYIITAHVAVCGGY